MRLGRSKWLWLVLAIGAGILTGFMVIRKSPPPAPQPSSNTNIHTATNDKPPNLQLDGSSSGQILSGVVTLSVAASDDKGVVKVEYYVDGVFLGVSYASPFDFALDTTSLTNGEHTLVAKAYDTAGHMTSSQSMKITVDNAKEAVATVSDGSGATAASARGKAIAKNVNYKANGGTNSSLSSSTPDTQSPSSPSNFVLSADDGYTANLNWQASSDNAGVSGYRVFRDGTQIGTSSSTTYQDQTVVPGNTYTYYLVAYDAAGNTSGPSTQPMLTLVSTTIWLSAESPSASSFDNSPGALELGVKFRPLVDGQIKGVRFYKSSGSTGTHTGSLWSSSGTQLATATFSGETASGWQEVSFSTPVNVTAGTTYVASYFAPNGGYGYASTYFASAGITSQYLTAMASGAEGNNGVFRSGSSGFPTTSFDNTNYWVDVSFAPNKDAGGPTPKVADNSKIYAGFPGSNNTGVPIGKRLPKRNRPVTIYNDGTLLKDAEINADVNIQANNVTVRNVRITNRPGDPLIWGLTQVTGKSGLTVEDMEIFGNGTDQMQYGILDSGTDFTSRRLNIYNMTQGIQSNVNVLVEDTYIHDQIYFDGDHNGGYLSTGGDNITLTHNTFQNPLNQTAVLALFCDFSTVTNVTATNNLLIGAGYSFYAPICAGSGNIKVHNNKFSREVWPNGGFNGPVTFWNPAQPGNEWVNNTWLEDGTPVNP